MGTLTTPGRRKINRLPILVIEQDADQWLLIRSALSKCFPEVEPVWVNNAGQSLTYLKNCSSAESSLPKLILLGLYEPYREEVWALLKSIKAHDSYQRLPVVILSASEDHQDVMKAYALGVASYITKPTTSTGWLACFHTFRRYWWKTVTL